MEPQSPEEAKEPGREGGGRSGLASGAQCLLSVCVTVVPVLSDSHSWVQQRRWFGKEGFFY